MEEPRIALGNEASPERRVDAAIADLGGQSSASPTGADRTAATSATGGSINASASQDDQPPSIEPSTGRPGAPRGSHEPRVSPPVGSSPVVERGTPMPQVGPQPAPASPQPAPIPWPQPRPHGQRPSSDAGELPPDATQVSMPPLVAAAPLPAPLQQPLPQYTHAPWTVAPSWGASSLNAPNTLAGLSYLFWWVSGLVVYFNERRNRFVRFHAVQSILLTGALTVVSVVLYILNELSADLAMATRQPAFAHLGQGLVLLGFLAIIALWLAAMIAAWSGHHLRLPIVGAYAERYAAPPRESPTPAPFAD